MDHFVRFYAFMERGWFRELDKLESGLWLAYEKRADNQTGIAYPSNAELAEAISPGESVEKHIPRLRARLVEYGLLEVRGRQGRSQEVRVRVPPEDAAGIVRRARETRAKPHRGEASATPVKPHGDEASDARSLTGARAKPHRGAREASPGRAPYKEEQTKEQTREQTSIPAAAPAGRNGDGGSGGGEGGARDRPKRRRRERVLTDEQNAIWREFTDWWKFTAWPKYHEGEVYDFKPVDGRKSIEIMRDPRFYFDLETVQALATLFLEDPEIYGNWDHTLSRFHQKRGWYLRVHRRRQQEGDRHVLKAAASRPDEQQRPERFAEPAGRLRQRFASAG
jgi:hypothetical protein